MSNVSGCTHTHLFCAVMSQNQRSEACSCRSLCHWRHIPQLSGSNARLLLCFFVRRASQAGFSDTGSPRVPQNMSRPQWYDMRIILWNRSSPWPSWTRWVVSSKRQCTERSHIHVKKLSFLVLAEGKVLPIKLALTLKDRSAFKLTNTFWHSSLACMLLQKCLLG